MTEAEEEDEEEADLQDGQTEGQKAKRNTGEADLHEGQKTKG